MNYKSIQFKAQNQAKNLLLINVHFFSIDIVAVINYFYLCKSYFRTKKLKRW